MATRVTTPPSMPARALTLDQAWERAYVALRASLLHFLDDCAAPHGDVLAELRATEVQLTQRLIDCGVGGTLAYQLARPPVSD